jgi:methyl-accepting chemotaxis protein
MAAAVVVVFLTSAWQSWNRLNSVNRIAAVAEVSGDLFTALHNLRVDRATTARDLNSDEKFASLPGQLKEVRSGDMPALKSAVAKLARADVPDRQNIYNSLSQSVTKLVELHQQTEAALAQPKSARPAGLAKEYFTTTTSLMDLLDKISTQLTNSVKLEDSYIDQLMELKQLAWIARNAGGDASVVISNALGGLPLPPDPMTLYQVNLAKVDTAWTALEDLASGLPVPARFKNSVDEAKREFFGADYTQLRMKTLKQLIAGEKVSTSADAWSQISVGKLSSLLNVAVAALDTSKEYTADQHAKILWKLWFDLGMLAAAIVLVAAMMLVVSRRVTGPLRNIQHAMLKVATGDFSVVLPGLQRKDEIGDIANAVERFKVLADEKARAEAEQAMQRQQVEADRQAKVTQAEAVAQAKAAEDRAKAAEEQSRAVQALGAGLRRLAGGDLSFRLNNEVPDAYKDLKDDFNGTMDQLSETVRALVESTSEVTSASAEISSSTTDLSQRTEEQAASLEQTSASMEEISVTVKRNAEYAQQANQSASGTRDVADRGGQVVAQAVQAMAGIEESSRKISDIIGVIDEIARQTNLLALNAAVEAARAGEAGRGFAVVASEVRSLAQRSSQAAKDIKDLITNSNDQVKGGVELVNRAGAALTEIVDSIKKVADIVADIANASNEQASGIEQVNKALTQMDEVTQQNSALVEENAATAKTLEHQARAMDERVSFFKLNGTTEDRPAAKHAAQPAAARAPRPAAAPPSRGTAAAKQPAAPKQQPAAAPRHAAAATNAGGPVRRMQAALATAVNQEPDWKEF